MLVTVRANGLALPFLDMAQKALEILVPGVARDLLVMNRIIYYALLKPQKVAKEAARTRCKRRISGYNNGIRTLEHALLVCSVNIH